MRKLVRVAAILTVVCAAASAHTTLEPGATTEPQPPWCATDADCPPGAECLDGTCKIRIPWLE